jgi:hypothetical protein
MEMYEVPQHRRSELQVHGIWANKGETRKEADSRPANSSLMIWGLTGQHDRNTGI